MEDGGSSRAAPWEGQSMLHPLLRRQLARVGIDAESAPASEGLAALLERVSGSYADADKDRYTLERALELSSYEMQALNVQLAAESRHLAAVMRSIGDGLCVLDADGRVAFANPAAERLLQRSLEELRERRIVDAFEAEDAAGAPLELEAARREWDGRARRADGSTIPVTCRANPIVQDGRVSGWVLVFRDVTERRRVLRETRAAKEAAESANLAKSQFLANMSHELRTPMNGVLGFISLVLDTQLTGEQRECLTIVRSSAQMLLTVLNDILDFSKIEAGKLELEAVDVDLRRLAEDLCEFLLPRAEEKGLDLVCDVAPSLAGRVKGDPTRLRQILMNLLGNSIKFTERGQVVLQVSAEAAEGGAVRVRLRVADSGIGIPADKRDRLFKPFSQVDATTTRHYGGTGLGLAIAQRLVDLMKGRIEFESERGVGTTFTVTLELERGADVECPAVGAGVSSLRVLVVEDNAVARRAVAALVADVGATPSDASTSETALAALRESARIGRPFDAVVVDGSLPGDEAFALVDAVRADLAIGRTPILVATSLEPSKAAAARSKGFDAVLVKPLRRDAVCEALSRIACGPPPGLAPA
jgi:two-component system, sensor histidine kinase and response regulator